MAYPRKEEDKARDVSEKMRCLMEGGRRGVAFEFLSFLLNKHPLAKL